MKYITLQSKISSLVVLLLSIVLVMSGCDEPNKPNHGGGGTTADTPAAPVIITHPSSQTVLVGNTVTLSVAVTAVTGVTFTYQWQTAAKGSSNFTGIEGATNSSYTTAKLGTNDNGVQYRVVVTATADKLSSNVTSSVATITVSSTPPPAAPVITTHPFSKEVLVGSTVTLSVAVTAVTGVTFTYQWQTASKGSSNFTGIEGATNSSYTTAKLGTNDNGVQYRVVVTATNAAKLTNTATSSVAIITVSSTPPPIGVGTKIVWTDIKGTKYSVEAPDNGVLLSSTLTTTKTDIKSVDTIPSKITSIGDGAFYGCKALESIVIPNTITSIGKGAFNGCSSLASINIPNSVDDIRDRTFSHCTNLSGISIANGIKNIGEDAFVNCANLKSIDIPSSVKSIGKNAFYLCKALINVTMQDGVTSIGEEAFQGCIALTGINIPSSVTSIGQFAFSSCTSITNITIPSGVTNIGNSAFQGCAGLTSVSIQNGVKSIGNFVFSGCKGLTGITIPSSLTSIGTAAFAATGLTSITIPSSVTNIGELAFNGCTSLTSVQMDATTPPTAGVDVFRGTSLIIKVPNDNVGAYKSAENWKTYASRIYGDKDVAPVIDKIEWTHINGTKQYANVPTNGGLLSSTLTATKTDIKSVDVIPSSVTRIGGYDYEDYGFKECTNLTSINIPSSVTIIKYQAFANCEKLNNIVIPSGVVDVGQYAFLNCKSLTSVTIKAIEPPTVTIFVKNEKDNLFFGVNLSNLSINVPSASVDKYNKAEIWSTYAGQIKGY